MRSFVDRLEKDDQFIFGLQDFVAFSVCPYCSISHSPTSSSSSTTDSICDVLHPPVAWHLWIEQDPFCYASVYSVNQLSRNLETK